MSGWTPSQAEGERDDQEGVDQSRGLSERHSAERSAQGGGSAPASAQSGRPSQAEGGRGDAEGAEQDRGER
ncbi:hypothetical protein CUT44_28055 [Streptomyces carminius]|uniref:Uncharacterized protein n=1 Tax=Streptomyces carminius TaxID=2665496 RepID=A0A2M8LQB5_9ACTN|nr:hypothetical protein [Streptomyces carminius]PJE94151.1 hypothetical protein CUT44_28055 [Streptomyces carminius]